jgi:cytoplasmic iron level regulating protein YaaA (DUF328/UPF0246 family)
MKTVISPAKSLDFEKQLPTKIHSQPHFKLEANSISALLKEKSAKDLSELMNISYKLAQLNWERNQNFGAPESLSSARPAIFTFNGDVYKGLDSFSFSTNEIENMQANLRVLSGLYGLLKPLDLIQPYRLEMGTVFPMGSNKNLYAFWKEKITQQLNSELEDNEFLVNLASNEYFSVIDHKNLKAQVITPQFKDFKNGKLKTISFYAKKARGMMARHLINLNANTLEDVNSFLFEGYKFSAIETNDPLIPVFIR